MQIQVEDAGPCRKKLRIEISEDRVAGTHDTVLKTYSRSAKIPGFRPGKAPREVVVRRYGQEVNQEVQDRLIPEGYREALEKESIEPVAVLGVLDVEFEVGRPLRFSVLLDVPPQFELPSYEQMTLAGQKTEVPEDEVDATVLSIRERAARFEDVADAEVKEGDLAVIDYEGVCEGKPIDELAPDASGLGSGKEFMMHAGEHAFLPGFAEGLLGAKAGEKRQVLVDFPADFAAKPVAGRKATYFVDVKAVREKRLPELDEAFLQQCGVGTEDELRAKIREDLEAMSASRENGRLKSEIVKHLLEHTKMDLPESVVNEETKNTVYDMVRENTARGVTKESIEGEKEKIFDAASRSAADKVKARYILHRIAEQEDIKASAEEVQARVQAMSAQYGMPEPEMRAALEKNNMMEGLADQVRTDNTLDFLLKQATVKQ